MKNSNKKILIVEDDINFGNILKEYLSLNDFNITLAKNGIEGFEKFKKDQFDLCLLDVMMPYKDGFTLAKEIREKNDIVPLIFLTAKTLKEDVLPPAKKDQPLTQKKIRAINEEVLTVWDTNANDWRAFRLDKIEKIENGTV